MKTVTIYGASDDLIEIDGDISEEFYDDPHKPSYLAFSDGTLVRVSYTGGGEWIVSLKANPKNNKTTFIPSTGADTDNYSDKLTITGDFEWIVYANEIAR